MSGRLPRPSAWLLVSVTILTLGACRDGGPSAEARFDEAEALRLAYEEGASRRAIVAYRDAREAWTRQGNREDAARAGRGQALTYEQLGLLRDAERTYLDALSTCAAGCSSALESALSSALGRVGANLADDEASLEAASRHCDRALALSRTSGANEEARALICSGDVAYHRGDLEGALALYRRAKNAVVRGETFADADTDAIADRESLLAEALLDEGSTLSDLSRFAESRAALEEALSLYEAAGDTRGRTIVSIALGRFAFRRGEYQEALNWFRPAAEVIATVGDRVWEASALGGTGFVYAALGESERALLSIEGGLAKIRETGIRTAVWDYLLAVGILYLELDQPSEALSRFRASLELAEETGGDHWKQAYSLQRTGEALRASGLLEESLESLDRALELQRSLGDPRLEAAVHASMGDTYRLMGRHERANDSFRQALELTRSASDRVGEAEALFGIAQVAESRGDLDAARDNLERSLEITESLREHIDSPALRTSYFASVYRQHELYVDVLMRLHESRPRAGFVVTAFEATERASAKALLESLTEAGIDLREGVDPALLERETASRRTIDAYVQRLRSEAAGEAGGDGDGDAAISQEELQELEAEHDLLVAEIRSRSPRYAALSRPAPLTLADVQSRLLDEDTVLLEYALGEERSYLFAIGKDQVATFVLEPRAAIEAEAEELYGLLTARAQVRNESLQERNRRIEQADAAYWEAAARLSEKLLGPVAERIHEKRIAVVASGALQHVPFSAFPLPRQGGERNIPLIAEHEVVHLPSASVLAVLREAAAGKEEPSGTVAVFADPVFTADDPRIGGDDDDDARVEVSTPAFELFRGADDLRRLEATRREAKAILELAPRGTALHAIDFDASRDKVKSAALGDYRIVHFATHGITNADHPTMSGIVLSMFDDRGRAQDGFLSLRDIYELDLAADLVVLSACSTALGRKIRGEGTIGIVRAFLYAGAERVVASLWKVEDDATHDLMRRFYREMLDEGRSPSAALRYAQLGMWRDGTFRFPFFWAAFVLQGEWRDT